MATDGQASRSIHPVLLWTVLAAALAAGGWQASHLIRNADFLPVHDFCEYWAAGRLNLDGQNPYDPDLLDSVQRPLGLKLPEPVLMWNPPWTLSLVMPLALLPFRIAQLLFLLLEITLVIGCADVTWRLYGGPAEKRWLSWLLAGSFLPTFFMIKGGQIAALMLVGAVGFLHFERRGQLFVAGMFAALLGIKPQIVYLFWPALLFWSIQQRRWQIIAGGLTAGLLASIPPLLLNPDVFSQYFHAVGHYAPIRFISPTVGTLLRIAAGEHFENLRFDGTHFHLQYLPPILGLVWLVIYWYRRRDRWDWAEEFPLLLLLSGFTALYGAWASDLVLLLVPLIQAAVWVLPPEQSAARRVALGCYLAIEGLAGIQSVVLDSTAAWFMWMGPALLAAWLVVRSMVKREPLAA